MVYLGYDANLVMGNRKGGGQHFWGEIKIDGVTYLLEVGEKVYDSPQWNYKWQFMCLKYSEADGVIPQSFFALINLRDLINHYCLFAVFFLTYNEEYVIMVQNRTLLRKGRVNVFLG